MITQSKVWVIEKFGFSECKEGMRVNNEFGSHVQIKEYSEEFKSYKSIVETGFIKMAWMEVMMVGCS